ncbi:Ycf66 family protein [Nostoc sp. PCC 7107]|uniref:Ycf66 family protein n=1 Tax=Nostoc sp. PCC 7107 TaxID=317936 RepID=UPI00029F4E59|nr:Ycf66 family protein [Nostoc sp. PCC 7107]AFY41265.1 Ycf66 family protein [Nostoc sp. PCC 7107]
MNEFILMQVNFGLNIASLIGFAQIVFAVAYLLALIILLIQRARRLETLSLIFYVFQTIIIPIFLLTSGLILVFHGWRLDPILQFMQLLSTMLIIYLCVKDIVINGGYRNR